MRLARLLGAIALLAAGTAVGAADPSKPVAKILPRSSVAAVLARRAELGLDDDQVRRLERIDDELQRRNAELPAAAPEHRSGGRRGAPGRSGSGGEPQRRPADPERVRNDNDTAAYLQAEEVLRPEQRDRAREIAERYREDLYDQRAAARKAAGR